MSNAPQRIAIPDLEEKLAGKSKPVVVDVRKAAELKNPAPFREPSTFPSSEFQSACPNYLKTKNLSSIAAGEDERRGLLRRPGTQVTGM
jgi:hypothetical protein